MNNLNLPEVAFNQNQKEVTINEQAMALDGAMTESLAVDLSTADVTLTQDQFTRNFVFVASGNAVARTLTVYASKRPFAVRNSGTADLTVKATGTGIVVNPGSVKLLRCDGSVVTQLAVEEAPDDGFGYARIGKAWAKIAAVEEAPTDGAGYARLGAAWAKLVAGANVALDATTPGQLTISATGGSAVFPVLTGQAGKYLRVNATEDGVEWATPSGGGASSAWHLEWSPIDNEPPASNYATLDTRNGRPVLDFDTATQEAAILTGIMPSDYSMAGVTVTLWCALSTATTGTVGWDVSFERTQVSVDNIDVDSFAAAQVVTAVAVPGTSGQVLAMTVDIADGAPMDNIAPGELFRIRIRRDVTNDSAAGDAELLRVIMVEQ